MPARRRHRPQKAPTSNEAAIVHSGKACEIDTATTSPSPGASDVAEASVGVQSRTELDDHVDDILSLEHLLTGPQAPFFHLAVAAAAFGLYTSPRVAPRVLSEDVELRPVPPIQELLWHVADTLHAVGFEAVMTAGLVVAIAVVGITLWRDHDSAAVGSTIVADDNGSGAVPTASSVQTDDDDSGHCGMRHAEVDDSVDKELEEEPPIVFAALGFVMTMAFMAFSNMSPLHMADQPLVIHGNVVAENARIQASITSMQMFIDNVSAALATP
mmetsp:Transcript_13380/g.34200  ORF Transcript_13380/g.34200 Transcript_13380/m.34200 type:complete len:271 (-) Transcript_13380:646-1458(-)